MKTNSELKKAMGDDDDMHSMLDDDDMREKRNMDDDDDTKDTYDDEDDMGEKLVKRVMDDDDDDDERRPKDDDDDDDDKGEEERDEGEGDPSVDPSVIAAINFGESLAPPSDPSVVSHRATAPMRGPVEHVPVSGQEILHHSGK